MQEISLDIFTAFWLTTSSLLRRQASYGSEGIDNTNKNL